MAVEYIRWGSTMLGSSSSRPEVWGGLECTVARVGDSFRDQCAETGHLDRPDDLDAIAGLGLRTVRYPVLWETISPDAPNECDWEWHDKRLHRLRELGIGIIATLCLPSRERTTLYEPSRSRVSEAPGRARRKRSTPVPLDQPVHTRKRAAHDGSLQRPLRALVP